LPTPLKLGKPDLSDIKKSWDQIKSYIQPGQLIILESTTYPGCTEDIFLNFLNKNFIIDKNIFLSYSPERENPGDKNYNFKNTPKIVSGIGKNSLILCKALYSTIVKRVYEAPNIKIAEASKLLENIYRSINIALINELSMACHKLNMNIYDIINLASTKPFGFSKFLPGPGTGGHCIPIDPIYFSWMSKKKGVDVKFIKLSAKINEYRTKWVLSKIKKIIKKFKKTKILLLGLAYKKNIEDTRESAPVKILKNLKKNKKILVDFCDPFVKKYYIQKSNKKVEIKSIPNAENSFEKYDIIIVATDHDIFNYNKIIGLNKILIDLRGRFINYKNYDNIYYL
jgi:UDP-N-acetyl-D-glucosamine dehydrogenase